MQNIKLIKEIKDSAKNGLFIINANEKPLSYDSTKLVFDALTYKLNSHKQYFNKLILSGVNDQKEQGLAIMIYLCIQAINENKDIKTIAFSVDHYMKEKVFKCFIKFAREDENNNIISLSKMENDNVFTITTSSNKHIDIFLIDLVKEEDTFRGLRLDCLFISHYSQEKLVYDKIRTAVTCLYNTPKHSSFIPILVANMDNTWVEKNLFFNKYLSELQ